MLTKADGGLAYYTDLSGSTIPLRFGRTDAQWQGSDTGANYNHAAVDHRFCNLTAWEKMFSNSHRGDITGIQRYGYAGYFVDNYLDVEMDVEAVVSDAGNGFGDQTPDNRPFGVITTYCNGYTFCPLWVNLWTGQ